MINDLISIEVKIWKGWKLIAQLPKKHNLYCKKKESIYILYKYPRYHIDSALKEARCSSTKTRIIACFVNIFDGSTYYYDIFVIFFNEKLKKRFTYLSTSQFRFFTLIFRNINISKKLYTYTYILLVCML